MSDAATNSGGPVSPAYWLTVCRAQEAINLLLYGPLPKPSAFFQSYPILMHSDFPATLDFCAEVAQLGGDRDQARLWSSKAEWLRAIQKKIREHFPELYATYMFNLGRDLMVENQGELVVNLLQGIACTQTAARLYEAQGDSGGLALCLADEARARSFLATWTQGQAKIQDIIRKRERQGP
jgi:hypothetical protein